MPVQQNVLQFTSEYVNSQCVLKCFIDNDFSLKIPVDHWFSSPMPTSRQVAHLILTLLAWLSHP